MDELKAIALAKEKDIIDENRVWNIKELRQIVASIKPRVDAPELQPKRRLKRLAQLFFYWRSPKEDWSVFQGNFPTRKRDSKRKVKKRKVAHAAEREKPKPKPKGATKQPIQLHSDSAEGPSDHVATNSSQAALFIDLTADFESPAKSAVTTDLPAPPATQTKGQTASATPDDRLPAAPSAAQGNLPPDARAGWKKRKSITHFASESHPLRPKIQGPKVQGFVDSE
jgi:hypothetical protein